MARSFARRFRATVVPGWPAKLESYAQVAKMFHPASDRLEGRTLELHARNLAIASIALQIAARTGTVPRVVAALRFAPEPTGGAMTVLRFLREIGPVRITMIDALSGLLRDLHSAQISVLPKSKIRKFVVRHPWGTFSILEQNPNKQGSACAELYKRLKQGYDKVFLGWLIPGVRGRLQSVVVFAQQKDGKLLRLHRNTAAELVEAAQKFLK